MSVPLTFQDAEASLSREPHCMVTSLPTCPYWFLATRRNRESEKVVRNREVIRHDSQTSSSSAPKGGVTPEEAGEGLGQEVGHVN